MTLGPICSAMSENAFASVFRNTVHQLAVDCNWHEHTNTWKHLKPGQSKVDLPTHVGLAAVLYAIRQNDVKFDGGLASAPVINKSLFTKTINTMIARQEIVHPQVMSYLVGGGDYYCNHSFKSIKWQLFDSFICRTLPTTDMDTNSLLHNDDALEEPAENIVMNNNDLNPFHQRDDVENNESEVFKAKDQLNITFHIEPFRSMSLWEFTETTTKVTKDSEVQQVAGLLPINHNVNHTKRSRRADIRGDFHPSHPQSHSHLLRPWVTLKPSNDTWHKTFLAHNFPPALQMGINNMNVENKCRDARDKYETDRHTQQTSPLLHDILPGTVPANDLGTIAETLNNMVDDNNSTEAEHSGIMDNITNFQSPPHGNALPITDADRPIIDMHTTLMKVLWRQKRSRTFPPDINNEHHLLQSHKQLFLYISGVGGAGKSHVINCMVEFMKHCNDKGKVLLSAPTGYAVVLIHGHTIHALTGLP
ncbi:hypothetical protein SERLADRAFT_407600 [Serpula lacrymans var. lacrymans S7.9]|uniref:ATP-dependent DNA helicase n=1 Tax=Serpula lacrymans var. lacrymans (strain S7.9) TaxID=578457 RepID=F8NQ70_SERL9|nr:uncharacterized protein SERLADRAFT_407600 [Serpula lacrymans var. lacrymans S7.9]EGO27022.1 hypothetical protein SERLADRAFT_407600 [Serpula lacrymans var. lacrymans S7.9]